MNIPRSLVEVPRLPISTPIPPTYFTQTAQRVVVSTLLYDHRGVLYLAQSAWAPDGQLVPLQEKAERHDRCLCDVAHRGLMEELGLDPEAVTLHPYVLHAYRNPVPARRGQSAVEKLTFVVGGYIETGTRFTLARDEVQGIYGIGPDELIYNLTPRPRKFCATVAAISEAVHSGLLPQNRWQKQPWLR